MFCRSDSLAFSSKVTTRSMSLSSVSSRLATDPTTLTSVPPQEWTIFAMSSLLDRRVSKRFSLLPMRIMITWMLAGHNGYLLREYPPKPVVHPPTWYSDGVPPGTPHLYPEKGFLGVGVIEAQGEQFLGYDAHIAVAVAEAVWSGNPNQVAIKPAPPGYILALHVAPGATNPGPIGLQLALQSHEIAPGLSDVVADRAYTNKRQSFVRPLHQMGINMTMDYTSTETNNPKFVKVGTNDQRLLNSAGTLFPPWIPEYMHIPPANTKPEDVTKWYVNRALWRWTRNRKLDNGGGQYGCSQCAGRVTTKAPTRNASVVPAETAPFLPIEDTQCCHGKVSIPADLLDAYQDIPFGTPAWKRSYGRRNPVEKTFSMIKDKGGLKAGWCRPFGLAAHTIGALALAIAHNLKQTLTVESAQTEKPAPPARPKSHQPTRRNILADSLTPRFSW